MLGKKGNALYIGKAKNLKKRVTAYTSLDKHSIRIQRMISATTNMEFITTHPHEVVGVLISSEGMVRHTRLAVEEPVEPHELMRLVRFLNQELDGMPLAQIHAYIENSLLETSNDFFFLYCRRYHNYIIIFSTLWGYIRKVSFF